MKKIALIEDRYPRQNHFLDQNSIDLNEYEKVLENFVEEKASNLLEQISNDSFDLSNFEIIICHKSVENNTVILGNLKNYCKKNNKTLVLFSGGISVNYYDNSEFELLELNSKTFYSQNLVLFLEALKTGNEDILMLCYGEYWKQNIVANVLEKTNRLINKIEEKVVYMKFSNFVDLAKLAKIEHKFYELQIENNRTTITEIENFRDSLLSYFKKYESSQENENRDNKSIVIHCNNVVDVEFENDIHFTTDDDVDAYISNKIIKELKSKEFDTIFIKDNLSSNYLELYGLRVAHHIRLSSELGDKRFIPIVIISDFDEAALCRFSFEANILFTEGIYLCKNTKEDILYLQSLELKGLSEENYKDFLNQIEVSPPKDTSGSHDIANQWSIYRWAEFLDVDTEVIKTNKEAIENKLYFKYLKALNFQKHSENKRMTEPTKKGKVLLIDDEWNKGWTDIIAKVLENDQIQFNSLNYEYKDKEFNSLSYKRIEILIKQFDPDVVLLDLRLAQSDHENDDIESYTGIKLLEKIHEINAGIQVIMLTATSKSTTLEKLYEKKILGYIKKEHPEDTSIDTVENINKLISLVDRGLDRKYLKTIYQTMNKIHDILKNDIFAQYGIASEKYEPFWKKIIVEVESIFDILDSNSKNRFLYAMVSISSSLEAILSVFIPNDRNMIFWDNEIYDCDYNALRCRITALFLKLGSDENFDMSVMIDKRNKYMHKKPVNVKEEEIVNWFKKLHTMIQIIQNPPNLKKYDKNNLLENLQNKFK